MVLTRTSPEQIHTEQELAAICMALGASLVSGGSPQETALAAELPRPESRRLHALRDAIRQGADPLGDAFCALRAPAARRPRGATYTPPAIVAAMIDWARAQVVPARVPARVIDPGCGSARFLVAAGRAFPHARLIGVDVDPLAALMARAHLAAAGLAARARVLRADYRALALEPVDGPTLFLGNPPYVRHHDIDPAWKRWLTETASAHGLHASQLAGLHVHFFLAIRAQARTGDLGVLLTAAEWLDVRYGRLARDLLAGPLGCVRIDILEPAVRAFPDAQSTAAITCFRVGSQAPSVHLRRVDALHALAPLDGGRAVRRPALASASRWTPLSRPPRRASAGLVPLGELCRVHRGQVTGANHVWIAGDTTPPLPPSVLFPAVTRARELFAAGRVLADAASLRRVIDIPPALDGLAPEDRAAIEGFLAWARERGAHASYIARHRSPWWAVKLREPPPILATYMARRPPAFVRNLAGARFLNIAHGIYPRAPLSAPCLDALAAYLSAHVALADGRTYAGGLTKFEPGEMERLLVPARLGEAAPRPGA